MIRRYGRKEGILSWIGPGLLYLSLAGTIGYLLWPYFYFVKKETYITIGLFALWRYSWQATHYVRALIYAFFVYPSLRRLARNARRDSRPPSHIYFIIPSFHEEPWVSAEAFFSIMSEMGRQECGATLIVAAGSDEDDAVINAVYESHPARYKVNLVLQRQSHGKRIAMGHALRAMARHYNMHHFDDPNCVTIFMDGDTYLEPRVLEKTIPLFSVLPRLGAATTNEIAYIHTTSKWYKDWFNLKFGQRHILFQSHSLARKVLTLTGRFSLFRTSIVAREEFITRIENDLLTHPFHGKFRFLMGDDKSSWFEVLRQGWEMLYVPDAVCYSLESRNADFLSLSTSLPYRWYGNTLRNNARALALGWRRTGFFIWLCLLDQRLSMWTALVGLSSAVILSFSRDLVYFPIFIAWVLLVRTIQSFLIALNGHPVSVLTIPLMLYNQWVGALIKIRAYYFLADQKWAKGEVAQVADRNLAGIPRSLSWLIPQYSMLMAYAAFLLTLLFSEQAIMVPDVQAGFWRAPRQKVILAADHGVIPDDGKDDAPALNHLLQSVADGAVVRLPAGTLDIRTPIEINRSHLTVQGAGAGKTVLRGRLRSPAAAVISIAGQRGRCLIRLDRNLRSGQSFLVSPALAKAVGKVGGRGIMLLRQPNDPSFCKAMGSEKWCKPYPYIRQTLVGFHAEGNRVLFDREFFLSFERQKTEIFLPRMVKDVVLKDMEIVLEIDGHDIDEVRGAYENSFPESRVDLVRLEWAAGCRIENCTLRAAGRHALVFENALRCEATGIRVDGAWNKGKGGNGYVRLARAYSCVLSHSRIDHIRHLVIQWSSAWNTVEDLDLGVDVNIHGGYPHHNRIRDIRFHIPASHPWKPVTRAPADASWAPPNGPGNVVEMARAGNGTPQSR